jgi:hypothetical protein
MEDFSKWRIGVIGFGEVGKTFAKGWRDQVNPHSGMKVWDLKLSAGFDNAKVHQEELAKAKDMGVLSVNSCADLVDGVNLIVSCVTASNTLAVAKEVSQTIKPGQFFIDLNSASPGTKQACAALIDAKGAFYVEAGVMTSVPPYGIKVPMLLGGVKAEFLAGVIQSYGGDAKAVSEKLGVASAIKMCRSIMIKGLEALVIESYTTARHYGVEQAMLATLAETMPGIDWVEQGAYLFSRVVQHGKRRAEEMRESAVTVAETGASPFMAKAIAEKQDWVSQLAMQGVFSGIDGQSAWQAYADALISHLDKPLK